MKFALCKTLVSCLFRKSLQIYTDRLRYSVVLFSSSSIEKLPPVVNVADYLVSRQQFTSEAASIISSVVGCLKNPKNCDFTLAYLRSNGFSQPLIEKLCSRRPTVLRIKFENVKSKMDLLLEMGFSPAEMAQLISSAPTILSRSVHYIRSWILQLERVMGCRSTSLQVLKLSGGRFGCHNLEITMRENIELLKGRQIDKQHILCFMHRYPTLFINKPERMMELINRVDEIGCSPSSRSYMHALRAQNSMTEKNWEGKLQLIQDLGLSREDVLSMFRRAPLTLAQSGNKLLEGMRFLLSQHDVDLHIIAKNPELLSYSVKNRLVPRFQIVDFLMGEKLLEKWPSVCTVCMIGNSRFRRMFVLPHACFLEHHKLPVGLCA